MKRREFFTTAILVSSAAIAGFVPHKTEQKYKTWFVKPGMESLVKETEQRTGRQFDQVYFGQHLWFPKQTKAWLDTGAIFYVWHNNSWLQQVVTDSTAICCCSISSEPSIYSQAFLFTDWRKEFHETYSY